jgi:hypothetical protein
MSRIIMFDKAGAERSEFSTSRLNPEGLTDEKTIQKLVFENPGLIPIDEIDPGSGSLAPLCRELTLRGAAGPVFLDMIGVTRRGRLVLVECKLWRNPQARREVIGQILEYAALVGRLSYGDLSALVSHKTGVTGPNPLWTLVKDRLELDDEAAFVDAVSASLASTAFDLIILGDGIRGEVEVVRSYLEAAGLRSRLSLVEVNHWRDLEGRSLYVPRIALRTHVIEHRIGVPGSGPMLQGLGAELEPPEPRAVSDAAKATKEANRAFWQRFIDQARFTHPDQPPPTHGANNWVRLAMPVTPLVAYRAQSPAGPNTRLGFFLRFSGEGGQTAFQAIEAELPAISQDTGFLFRIDADENRGVWDISLDAPEGVLTDEGTQLGWLLDQADRLVAAFRPRLAQLAGREDDGAQ